MLINQANQGQGAARTTAIQRCHSEYVAFMDADDISLPDRFRLQINYLDDHPDVVMVGTQIEFLIGSSPQRALRTPTDHDQIEGHLLKGRAGFCSPSLMFRRKHSLACESYPAGIFGEDIHFCLSMCELGRVANLDEILFRYRLHVSQTSLARSREVASANSYAAYRATCRRKGASPLTFDSFLHDATLTERWQWSIEAWTLIHYRTARIQLACGKPIAGYLRMALVAICRPWLSLRRIAQIAPWHKGSSVA